MSKLKTLEDFYYDELKDLHNAEKQILKALPKMVKRATSEELKETFQNHLDETENQVERLEQISKKIGKRISGKKCKGMEGIIDEGSEILKQDADSSVKDAALIAAAQRVEHYEIAAYGCAKTYARLLNDEESGELLQQSLNEEKNADKKLNELAEKLNVEALETAEV